MLHLQLENNVGNYGIIFYPPNYGNFYQNKEDIASCLRWYGNLITESGDSNVDKVTVVEADNCEKAEHSWSEP